MGALLLANLAFALAVAIVAAGWWRARRTAPPDGTVSLRVRVQALDDDAAARIVSEAAGELAVAPPVLGDRSLLVEVPMEQADAVLADLLAGLLGAGYEISRERARTVVLRRGPDRVTVTAGS